MHAANATAPAPAGDAVWAEPRADGRRVALLLPSLVAGGAEVCALQTADGLLRRGFRVDLVLCERTGPLVERVPPDVRVIELKAAPMLLARAQALAADPKGFRAMLAPILLAWQPPQRLPHLPRLVHYLRAVRPDALFSAITGANLLALWARRLAGVQTRILISERNTVTAKVESSHHWRNRHLPQLLGHSYPMADGIVAVSNGVADDLAKRTGIPRDRITTVYNPVVTPELAALAGQPVAHPWFQPGAPPVILGVGSLTPRKDFPTLIRAFARVRAARDCRLVILGEGASPKKTTEQQTELKEMARSLGVADNVDLPGYIANPFAYMARASVFVLASVHEGLPGVLIQALACGCPAVSTDCPYGPAEILDESRFGPLVPIGDDAAMAAAVLAMLDDPIAAARLKERADLFSVERAVDRYIDLMFDQG